MTGRSRYLVEAILVACMGVAAIFLAGHFAGWTLQQGIRRALFLVGGTALVLWALARLPRRADAPSWPARHTDAITLPDERSRELYAVVARRGERPAALAAALRSAFPVSPGGLPADLLGFLESPDTARTPDLRTLRRWLDALEEARA